MRSLPSLVASSLLLWGCSDPDPPAADVDAGEVERDVTYYADVKPILDARCVGCHNAEGIGPFQLDNAADAIANAGVAKLAVEAGIMPPWKPNDDCNDYFGSMALTAEEKETLIEWVDGGSIEGEPETEGDAIEVERTELSRVDMELEMPEAYSMIDASDDYRCFVIDWPEDETTYVTGFRAVPGNPKSVHHVIAFLAQPGEGDTYKSLDEGEDGPGYTCFGGTGGPARSWIGSWVPGNLGSDMPANSGIRVEPGSTIVLQVHYNKLEGDPATPAPDKTKLQIKLDSTVEREGSIMPWANPQWLGGSMPIPANEEDVMHTFAFDPTGFFGNNKPMTIYGAGLHMHQLGTRGTLAIDRAGGGRDCVLQIDDWDFKWQGSYGLREPMTVNPGDQLYIECHWDNTSQNQPRVGGEPMPPQPVNWGEGTRDEMCLGGFYWTP